MTKLKLTNSNVINCDMFRNAFKSAFNLECHIKTTHDNGGRYSKCQLCMKDIISSNLNSHMEKAHTSDNNNKCPTCGKILKMKVMLQRHIEKCTKSRT